MKRSDCSFARILAPVDDSSCAQRAFIHALSFAHAFRSEVDLLHVIEHPETRAVREEPMQPTVVADIERAARRYLAVLSRGADSEVRIRVHTYTAPTAAAAILQAAAAQVTDLIVIGARGQHAGVLHEMGGTAAKIVRGAHCPVLTVGPAGGRAPEFVQRILVPIDFSAPARRALRLAGALAYWLDAELLLVHVVTPADHVPGGTQAPRRASTEPGDEALKRAEEHLHACVQEEQLAVRWRVLCERARPADGILRLARRYDAHLIVQGASGSTGWTELALGSVAADVTRRARCSVITARGPAPDDESTAWQQAAEVVGSGMR